MGAAALVIIVAAVAWFSKTKHGGLETIKQTSNTSTTSSSAQSSNTQPGGEVWTGTLQNSDNKAKGNLMLVTADRNIYIKTSRDFSALVGKKVDISYEGDVNNFVLGNIAASEPK